VVLAFWTPQQVKCTEALTSSRYDWRVTHKSSKVLRSSLMTLKRFMAMNIFILSKLRPFWYSPASMRLTCF
jgi:hypothetical protein